MQYLDQTGISPNHSSRWNSRVRLFVLHTQQGDGTAASLARYLQNPASQVSYHDAVDNDTAIAVVDTDRASWSVLDANPYCDNLCFAGSYAEQSRAEWMRDFDRAIDFAALRLVEDAKKYDPLSPVLLDWDEVGAGRGGATDHHGITMGLGIGNHTDVGKDFPWDYFGSRVDQHATGYLPPKPVPVPNAIDAEAVVAAAWIGKRITAGENPTPDGRGRWAEFEHGLIYWTPTTGAQAVPRNIFETWGELGWEAGALGYPIGRHTVLATDGGVAIGDVQGFEGGAIYRRYGQPGFFVTGQIRDRWNRSGFEGGQFGWPTSNEVAIDGGGRVQEFERGRITWSPDGTTALQPVDGPDVILPDPH